MRVVGLISGGKDSIFNLMQCKAEGHELVALANLYPSDSREEMDSYMYQTVGHTGIEMIATALDLPLYRRKTSGVCRKDGQVYTADDPTDEVEDLYHLLHEVKTVENAEAVASGAILSDYQRCRVENVCERLQLTSLSYLWRRNQTKLLQEMIDGGVEAIVIKVAALGLTPEKHLGKSLKEIQKDVMRLNEFYGVNVCGEGGEYETFTLDCPLFKYKIVLADKRIVTTSGDVGYIVFEKLSLEKKGQEGQQKLLSRLSRDTNNGESLSVVDIIEKHQGDFEYLPKAKDYPKTPTSWIWLPAILGKGQDSEEGAKDAMEQLKNATENQMISLKDIVFINIFVRSMKDFAKINLIYSSIFNFPNPPSRACVETSLPGNVWLMLEALAVRPDEHNSIDCVHVQGISHWAPSNIGPYSQGKRCGTTVTISGQIGLIPGKMTLPPDGDFPTECALSLRNADCVVHAIDSPRGLRNASLAICYLQESQSIPRARAQWSSLNAKAIVNYVVVSALPRNAQIEWQILLHSPETPLVLEEFTHQVESLTLHLQKLSNASDSFEIVSGTISLQCDTAVQFSSQSIEDLLERIRRKFNFETPNKGLHCRIFYKASQEELLVPVLLAFVQKVGVNFILIPVLDLTDNGIATVTFVKLV
ncbi:uncharacterized protein LOC132260264 [Phlebotomus argentipes]|uniref:uncharacterized protein LOC132260264 n=1 Tax=Phlebotomus argentipes TaxID=94469 RepID=UPI0028929A0C|nr:uncharacterized protein LOC132260264 [Phlebotomus argentipes]